MEIESLMCKFDLQMNDRKKRHAALRDLNGVKYTYYGKHANFLFGHFICISALNITIPVCCRINWFLSVLCHRNSLYNDKWRKYQQFNTFIGSSGWTNSWSRNIWWLPYHWLGSREVQRQRKAQTGTWDNNSTWKYFLLHVGLI